jgi:acetaldehyde dehydrogenase (acetylating)
MAMKDSPPRESTGLTRAWLSGIDTTRPGMITFRTDTERADGALFDGTSQSRAAFHT